MRACMRVCLLSSRTSSTSFRVFTRHKQHFSADLPIIPWIFLGEFPRSQPCAAIDTSCYVNLYSIFSLQLASTHSFHSNGLGGIED